MFRWWERRLLREEEKGEGDGGGGFKLSDADRKALLAEFMAEVKKVIPKPEKKQTEKAKVEPPKPEQGDDDTPDDESTLSERERLLKKKLEAMQVKQAKALEDMQAKQAKLEAEAEARAKAAQEKERVAAIRSELSKHQLNPDSVDDAFRFFRDEVKFNEAGELVAGEEETPLSDFVKGTVEKKTTWLPPRNVGGAGAESGKGGKPAKPVDLADIKPGMSPEDRARVYEAIKNQMVQG